MFAVPIFMQRFKSINFYQNIPKIKLFLQKNAKFFVLGAPPQDPLPGSQNISLLRISGNAPGVLIAVMLFCEN